MLAQVEGLGRRIGDRWLFRGADLTIRSGDRIGIVGPNGAGKSTLLKIVAGDDTSDEGRVVAPRTTSIGMLRQEIDPRLTHTVQEEAATALAKLDALERRLRELEAEMTEAGERGEAVNATVAEEYDRISAQFERSGGFDREARVARVLAGLGFDDAARARPLSSFSGGWLMRVELAKLFLANPDVLLLDEPTNHLDLPAIQWFETAIDAFQGAVLIVSHDRTFLRRHVGRVLDIDGHGRAIAYEGDYDSFLAKREERRGQLLAQKANQDREIAQMERFVERFRAKATKAKQAQSRIKALEKIERIEVEPDAKRTMRLKIPPPPRSGEQVIALSEIHKAYDENPVYSGVDALVRRGERVALVGPNGAGKSTLLRIIAGALSFDSGERTLGHNVEVAFFAQHQLEALVESRSILEEISASAHTEDVPRLRGQLGAFLFSGDDVDKKISVLSGGEKARVALAKLLLRPSNLLVLDEPTNHLDIPSCEVLEQALQGYGGTLVFVSHDRAFINALATRVIEVRYGILREFSGNYDDYLYRVDQIEKKEAGVREQVEQTEPSPSQDRAGDTPRSRPTLTKAERQQERERRKQRDKTQRRIEKLEAEIQQAEEALQQLDWRLGDPTVYADAERVTEIQAEKASAQQNVDAHYAEWERLNDELTAIEDALDGG